ncbi:hypothetical protein RM863_29150 [Streptomyces sp. DSM 41014]|uniref:Uncharacterized protein n=1 Tax=Streptomyces hintoniae TaxID=3075521 RepID=A0ABU2UT16_9ACTN|nr:hypothetical protein [Streptomyces sp. DSM 41014]MDT0476199.1 hypothetical protein [Streptomyces sp. DSM 41014]
MAKAITHRQPGFIADVLEVDGETVCLLTPEVATDSEIRKLVESWMTAQGVDCGACLGCPVGAMRQDSTGAT